MAGTRLNQIEVFLDTAYAIALTSSSDRFHDRAVLLEIGNALSK